MKLRRRHFLALCGPAATGLLVGSTTLVELPRELVLRVAGQCSFCGRDAAPDVGMAGVGGRPSRICSACVHLCFQIYDEEGAAVPGPPPPLPPPPPPPTDTELQDMFPGLGEESRHLLLESVHRGDLAAALERVLADEAGFSRFVGTQGRLRDSSTRLQCSFCDAPSDEVRKLIAGPDRTNVCDRCVAGAAALLGAPRVG